MMLLLVAKAHETFIKYRHPHVGRFCGPRNYNRMADTVRAGYVWAADNDAFNGFDADAYQKMLDYLTGVPGCLFVTCPDVVADAEATFDLFLKWGRKVLETGQPLGYVIQDGATVKDVPWNAASAVFIGGSTEWKLSTDAEHLAREAKDRGKWLHMGRVNTLRRIEYAKALGCDSIDGTSMSWFTDTYLPRFAAIAAGPTQTRFQEVFA